MRLDRLLTLGVFRLVQRAGRGTRETGFPILMYHSISNDLEPQLSPYYKLATSPRQFAHQMRWLAELGCTGLSLEEALSWPANRQEHRSPVALTFDDGFCDFYTAAWPVLQAAGFTATMYLPTSYVGAERRTFCGRECLSWSEVRELRAGGIRFGSHTVTHRKLAQIPWLEVKSELALSKECLQQELGEEVSSFAFPYAFPQEDRDFRVRFGDLLRSLGYRTCVTTVVGRNRLASDPLCLKRLPANSCDDRALFEAKLEGAYDWLGWVQRVYRQLKYWRHPFVKRPQMEMKTTAA